MYHWAWLATTGGTRCHARTEWLRPTPHGEGGSLDPTRPRPGPRGAAVSQDVPRGRDAAPITRTCCKSQGLSIPHGTRTDIASPKWAIAMPRTPAGAIPQVAADFAAVPGCGRSKVYKPDKILPDHFPSSSVHSRSATRRFLRKSRVCSCTSRTSASNRSAAVPIITSGRLSIRRSRNTAA